MKLSENAGGNICYASLPKVIITLIILSPSHVSQLVMKQLQEYVGFRVRSGIKEDKESLHKML